MKTHDYLCAICQVARQPGETWFLVFEKPREDKLRVLEWEDRLAGLPGVLCACSAFHVQQLVAHWMTTGALGYPMAQAKTPARRILPWSRRRGQCVGVDESPSGGRPLGELSVHRESLNRILLEQPESLLSVLDALMSALRRGVWQEELLHSKSEKEREVELVPCSQ